MSADFVAHMEDVLDLYAEPYDPARPVVCFDETSTQLLGDARPPIPAKPRRPRREDYEYVKGGTRNLFLTCEPLTAPRQAQEAPCGDNGAAHQDGLRPADALAGGGGLPRGRGDSGGLGQSEHPSQSVVVRGVPGGGGPAHRPEAGIAPHAQAWQLAESCPEPAEGMAEIEFSVISRRCLGQRHPDEDSLCREVHALEQECNEARAIINWRFTTQDARTKLHRLYLPIPSVTIE